MDAVYNWPPNDQHVLWSIRALEAGKHVLCEKPIALSAAQGRVLVEATRRHHHLKVMEALMYRHHPQWRKAKELVETGQIGELRAIQVFFSFYNDDPGNIRNSSSKGGGALMDIGCYASSLSRWLFNAEPHRVSGSVVNDPHWGLTVWFRLFSTSASATQRSPAPCRLLISSGLIWRVSKVM